MERYKTKRMEIQDLQQDLMQAEKSLSSMTNEEANRLQSIQVLENKLASLQKDVVDQEAKQERAQKTVQRSAKDLRKRLGVPQGQIASEELDFKVRELKEMGNLALEALARVTERRPEIVPRVNQLLQEVCQNLGMHFLRSGA